MKKLNIFLMMALALGFTSCEEEWVEALPQQNDQEALFTAEDFVAKNTLASAITLTEATADEVFPVAEFVSVTNLPAGATVEFAMEMAKNEDFSDAVKVNVTNDANAATAKVADLQAAYLAVQGRNPEARVVNVRYAAYVVNGTEKVRVNGLDKYFGQAKVTVTPYDPGFRMENKYYLVYGNDPDALSVESAVEFMHSDKDIYDDTKFTVIVDIPAGEEFYWGILPESAYNAGTLDGIFYTEDGMEYETVGMLLPNNPDLYFVTPGIVEEAGKFQFTVDMYSVIGEDGEYEEFPTYEITPAFDFLYTPGNSNGWNHANSNLLFTSDYVNYKGFAYLNGEFKFTNAPDWSHGNYGSSSVEGELMSGSNNNFPCSEPALYWVVVNMTKMSFTKTKIESLGMIGDFNGWGSQLPMTAQITAANDIKYVGEVTLTAGQGFKFRCNDDWGINLGGDNFDELTLDGANLSVSEDGTYEVVLDLSTLPYKATVTKK